MVYTKQYNSQAWTEYARTERIVNNLNPEFSTKISIGYRFEEVQKLKFKIYDIDSRSTVLEDHDFLGEAECTLGQIVSSGTFITTLEQHNNQVNNKGQLCVRAEEVGSLKEEVNFLIIGQSFKKSGIFSKPDPFLEIYKDNTLVYRSIHFKNNCNPVWPKFSVPMRSLRTREGHDTKLLLKSWNFNQNGKHKLIGEVSVTTTELTNAPNTFNLIGKVWLRLTKVYLYFVDDICEILL